MRPFDYPNYKLTKLINSKNIESKPPSILPQPVTELKYISSNFQYDISEALKKSRGTLVIEPYASSLGKDIKDIKDIKYEKSKVVLMHQYYPETKEAPLYRYYNEKSADEIHFGDPLLELTWEKVPEKFDIIIDLYSHKFANTYFSYEEDSDSLALERKKTKIRLNNFYNKIYKHLREGGEFITISKFPDFKKFLKNQLEEQFPDSKFDLREYKYTNFSFHHRDRSITQYLVRITKKTDSKNEGNGDNKNENDDNDNYDNKNENNDNDDNKDVNFNLYQKFDEKAKEFIGKLGSKIDELGSKIIDKLGSKINKSGFENEFMIFCDEIGIYTWEEIKEDLYDDNKISNCSEILGKFPEIVAWLKTEPKHIYNEKNFDSDANNFFTNLTSLLDKEDVDRIVSLCKEEEYYKFDDIKTDLLVGNGDSEIIKEFKSDKIEKALLNYRGWLYEDAKIFFDKFKQSLRKSYYQNKGLDLTSKLYCDEAIDKIMDKIMKACIDTGCLHLKDIENDLNACRKCPGKNTDTSNLSLSLILKKIDHFPSKLAFYNYYDSINTNVKHKIKK